MTSNVSLLKPLGYQRKQSCGYCKSHSGSSSYYLSCEEIRPDHYQILMDRGWRRSGHLYYKPDLPRSCCPHYTIRLEAAAFKPKKSQRQAVNQWNRYVLGSEYLQKIKILCPRTRDEKRRNRNVFDLHNAVHMSELSNVRRPEKRKDGQALEPAHQFEVTLESDAFTREKYEVFLKYQMKIHNEPKSRWGHASFQRFLCSGLNQQLLKIRGNVMKIGSYHQCYRLDGKLIAVGVLDLLPRAVSSVYLFYDPDYEQWEFGKLSAMREIALTIEGKYDYYYMGFYIHSCVKMRYKASFGPCYMLDPESLEWNPFNEEHRKKLDQKKYVSLSHDRDVANGALSAEIPPQSGSEIARAEEADTGRTKPEQQAGQASREPKLSDYRDDIEFDSDPSDVEDDEIPEGSLFTYNVPGVLKLEEVKKLDLNHWKLLVRNILVDLEDIRGWEDFKIEDPYSIKGIAAELIATTGPELMKDSALVLF